MAVDAAPVGITAALVAASGGRSSPFSLLYPLPVLHAARVGAALCAVVEVFSWRFPIAGGGRRRLVVTRERVAIWKSAAFRC